MTKAEVWLALAAAFIASPSKCVVADSADLRLGDFLARFGCEECNGEGKSLVPVEPSNVPNHEVDMGRLHRWVTCSSCGGTGINPNGKSARR